MSQETEASQREIVKPSFKGTLIYFFHEKNFIGDYEIRKPFTSN